jgi:hypothetical protein
VQSQATLNQPEYHKYQNIRNMEYQGYHAVARHSGCGQQRSLHMSSEAALRDSAVLWALWAKLGPARQVPRPYHPLICHMIDVAAVARAL